MLNNFSTIQDSSLIARLQVGDWTLSNPFFDAVNGENILSDCLQVRIAFDHVALDEVVQSVQKRGEEDISPGQLLVKIIQ